MKNKSFSLQNIILLFMVLSLCMSGWGKQETEQRILEQNIDSWLILGPLPIPLPAFHGDEGHTFSAQDILDEKFVTAQDLKPSASAVIRWTDGKLHQWKAVDGEKDGLILNGAADVPTAAYLAFFVDVKRWTRARITLKTPQLFRLYFDGDLVAEKKNFTSLNNGKNSSAVNMVKDLTMETGRHTFLIKTVTSPESSSAWTLKASLSIEEKSQPPVPVHSIYTSDRMSVKHLLDGPKLTGVSVSPDGSLAALSFRQSQPPGDDSESWLELRRIQDGRTVYTFRGGMSLDSIKWAPCGHIFSYSTREKSKGTIWIVDLAKGTSQPIIKDVENLGGHEWAPDCSYIIYSKSEKGETDLKGVKRYRNLADRIPGWRNRYYLYKVNVPDGTRQRLTAGSLSTYPDGVGPDGKKILFSRNLIDYSKRPFSITELFIMDLETLACEKIWSGSWLNGAEWGPDGKNLLFLGGPSLFGEVGMNLPQGMVPNDYDIQAYMFNLETKKAKALTRDFDPSIERAFWDHKNDAIYFQVTERSFRRLYRYDVKKEEFTQMNTDVEIVEDIDFARDESTAVFIGSSSNIPPKAYVLNLKKNKSTLFLDAENDNYKDVKFGKVEQWNFKTLQGKKIEGRVYFPPDFDDSKKYPCIVYYYGGTTPVTRDFGGRYPKNLWAANGYVVYVLQPSGATGFGQEFSAFHVNDWGRTTAAEIIEGTKKFLKAHSFIDPDRVGCIGASYGGFMTMLLCTRTDIFAAAVAHAGISSLASYWGEGYWGYSYSAVATADSYPWNRKDIYLDQSPLFSADKITTPLLLLHGSVDTNVPPGESTQLFTALKILGRDVEYIQILDQNHHIMTYSKRIIWTKTILAWFDKQLKDQPEWWNNLYPEK
ncbi:MAG: S9 family peptidase [Candidatus Aminicenantes bacterium]|nr:S9 family peptidase [Candidatus Aminicenantes bacterium]